MIKAGIIALGIAFVLLLTATQTNAQSPKGLGLVHATEKEDICSSPLRPYIITYSNGCPIQEVRQEKAQISIKEAKAEEFSIAHGFNTATYTPTTIKSEPTPTPQVTATPTVKPTTGAQTTTTPSPTEAQTKPAGNNPDVIFELINQHRAKIGKAPFQKNEALCSLAQVRSGELAGEIQRGTLHSGLYNRNTSYRVIENAKVGGDESETVRWWLNSGIHRAAIQSDYVYSCGGCTGKNCAQLFTNYDPKNHTASRSSK